MCLDSAGVSGLPLCMFGAKHNVCWCLLVLSASAEHISAEWSQRVEFMLFSTSIIQLRGAKVSSLVSFSSLVQHIKLMFVGVVELSRTYFS